MFKKLIAGAKTSNNQPSKDHLTLPLL